MLEPCEQRVGFEEARARGRELDGQRQAVEPRADGLDRCVRLDVPAHCTRTLDEERDRVGRVEWVEGVFHLAGDAQRRSARSEHAKTRGCGQEVGDRRSGGEEVLEVVEEQHELAVTEKAAQVVGGADRLRDLGRHEIRVGERGRGRPRRRRPRPSRRARPRPAGRVGSCRCRPAR